MNQVTTVAACQAQAVAGGFNTFGVQNGGECRVGNAPPFNKYGAATGCGTLGTAWTNQVYQLVSAGSTGAGFVAPTITDPLSYAVYNGQTAQYSSSIGPVNGGSTLDLWNPSYTDTRIPTMGYQLLATWSTPVVVSVISVMFQAASNDTVHGAKTLNVFTNTMAAGGTLVQSFPVPTQANVVQSFTLSAPMTTSVLMLEFVPSGQYQVIVSNLSFA
jgi:hypothetical protein